MKRTFDFSEIVTYNHSIKVVAKSEKILDEIEDALGCMIDDESVECKEDLFNEITRLGGEYEYIEDGGPYVEYE